MSKDNGGPAFPNLRRYHTAEDVYETISQGGMTLRDYFAAKAMRIMWGAYDKGYCGDISLDIRNNELISIGAYQIADAMLAEREK